MAQKGKHPWPANATSLSKFGQSKNQGGLKWDGVLIKADFGTPIKVISHGRVAFSDWLQGFGFITIIDHGDGYMSLYGNSESLFKQTGDWISAGDVIATAGDSGGQPQSGNQSVEPGTGRQDISTQGVKYAPACPVECCPERDLCY